MPYSLMTGCLSLVSHCAAAIDNRRSAQCAIGACLIVMQSRRNWCPLLREHTIVCVATLVQTNEYCRAALDELQP